MDDTLAKLKMLPAFAVVRRVDTDDLDVLQPHLFDVLIVSDNLTSAEAEYAQIVTTKVQLRTAPRGTTASLYLVETVDLRSTQVAKALLNKHVELTVSSVSKDGSPVAELTSGIFECQSFEFFVDGSASTEFLLVRLDFYKEERR